MRGRSPGRGSPSSSSPGRTGISIHLPSHPYNTHAHHRRTLCTALLNTSQYLSIPLNTSQYLSTPLLLSINPLQCLEPSSIAHLHMLHRPLVPHLPLVPSHSSISSISSNSISRTSPLLAPTLRVALPPSQPWLRWLLVLAVAVSLTLVVRRRCVGQDNPPL